MEVFAETLICTQVILDISKSKQENEKVQSGISGIRKTPLFQLEGQSSSALARALTGWVKF